MSQTENSEEIYYHYTSVPAFYNIIASKSLWLTSLKTSNDKTELYYQLSDFDVTLKCINDNFPEEFKESFYDKFKLIYQSYHNNKEKVINLNSSISSEPYGICFTSLKDSLAHWSLYGDNMQGVCICFSYNAFLNLYDSPTYSNIIINSNEILYHHDDIIKLIVLHLSLFYSFFENNTINLTQFLKDNGWILCVNTLLFIKNFIKKEQFSVEKESRLFYDGLIMNRIKLLLSSSNLNTTSLLTNFQYLNNIVETSTKLNSLTSYNVFHNQIRAYQSMSLQNIWSSKLIPQVILGPKCVQDTDELQGFLKSHGLTDTRIAKSEIPLR